MSYEPGTYVKGEDRRVARRKSDAVALVFDGYALETTEDAPAPVAAPTVSATSEVQDTPTDVPAKAVKAPKPTPPIVKD